MLLSKNTKAAFTLIELVMVIVIIGILAVIAVPKFLDLRQAAQNAAAEANIGALREAISIYYKKTVLDRFGYLCVQWDGDPATSNPFRLNLAVSPPCYPASISELEQSLLVQPINWTGTGGACYDSGSGSIGSCH